MLCLIRIGLATCQVGVHFDSSLRVSSEDKKILPPTGKKVQLGFFSLGALQFWEMALVFHYYLEKFGLNIFPNLKSQQIKYEKYF